MKLSHKLYSSKIWKILKSIKTPEFIKNMYSHHKYVLLAIIVTIAIFIFGRVTRMREGLENADEKMTGSYIAPAGNTVLFDTATNDTVTNDMATNDTINSNNKRNNKRNNKKNKMSDGLLGISRSEIPDGDDDLYILKSQVIPPVCPACPNVTVCPGNGNGNGNGSGSGNEPPPCPPCARCPEPAFDCKKVPNFNRNDSDYLPRPVLADFSQFGM